MFANDRRLSASLDHYLTTEPEEPPRKRVRYVVAFYLTDQRYGGPEEGGWYYTEGTLLRISRVFGNEYFALAYCRRANELLGYLQRDRPSIYHTNSDGRIVAEIHEDFAPQGYPDRRPHYE